MTDCSAVGGGSISNFTTCTQLDTLTTLVSILIVMSLIQAGVLIWLALRISMVLPLPPPTAYVRTKPYPDSAYGPTPESFLKTCSKCGAKSPIASETCVTCGSRI